MQEEFQREKEDILDTIRELSRQLKLKQLVHSPLPIYIPLPSASSARSSSSSSWCAARLPGGLSPPPDGPTATCRPILWCGA